MSVREGAEHTETMVDEVDRAMFVRYAGASGDFNPIHWNEGFAKSAGYPGVFAQGMFTAGVLGSFLTNWLGESNVRRFRTRFVGQVWPGEAIVCRGTVTRVYDEGDETRADLDLEVTNADGERKIDGSATVVLR
ncbi:MAG: MaoC/PaaZ C-terminal domain-containing protein [Actinomycetota bacterium]